MFSVRATHHSELTKTERRSLLRHRSEYSKSALSRQTGPTASRLGNKAAGRDEPNCRQPGKDYRSDWSLTSIRGDHSVQRPPACASVGALVLEHPDSPAPQHPHKGTRATGHPPCSRVFTGSGPPAVIECHSRRRGVESMPRGNYSIQSRREQSKRTPRVLSAMVRMAVGESSRAKLWVSFVA